MQFQSRGHLVNELNLSEKQDIELVGDDHFPGDLHPLPEDGDVDMGKPALVPDYKILTTQVHFLPTKIFVVTMKVMMAVVMARPLQIFRAVCQQTKKQMDNQVFTHSHQNFFPAIQLRT